MSKQIKHIGYKEANFTKRTIENTPQEVLEYVPAEQPSETVDKFKQFKRKSQSFGNSLARFATMTLLLFVAITAVLAASEDSPEVKYQKAHERASQAEYELATHKLEALEKVPLGEATDQDVSEINRLRQKLSSFTQGN